MISATKLYNDPSLSDELVKALSIPEALSNSPREPAYAETGSRTCSAQDILERAQKAAEKLGMSHLVDITGLDNVGIPVFSATNPNVDAGLITVFNGKGTNLVDAALSAMMELIERVSSSARDRQMIHGTFEELNSLFYGQVLNPNLLIIHRKQISIETVPLSWTWAFDVGRNIPVLVPATAVYHPFYDESGPLFINNSCGLASGTNLLEAVIQALCEVIERDALSLAMASNVFRSVPIETINSALCRALITNFHKANIHVTIKEITTNLGVPCFVACSDDRSLRNSFYLNGGYGCHVNRDKALTRAIVELAQSRATIISGAREDIPSMRNGDGSDYDKIRRINYRWFEDVEPIQFYTQLPTYNFNNLWEEFNWLLDCVQTAGLPGPIVADLTRPEVKIPVVRVLVPGLECWYQDHKRIGQRLITAFRIGLKLGVAWKGEG